MVKAREEQQVHTQRHTGGRARRGYGRLELLSQEKGMTIIEVVKDAIRREHSVYGAAQKLGVSPNTVSYHLRKAGLAFRPVVTVEFFSLSEVTA